VGRSFRLSCLARYETLEIDSSATHTIVIGTLNPAKILPRSHLEA